MKDRVAQNPNNYLVTPEGGGAPYNAVITRADNPTEPGTPFNTASMLKDTTASQYGLTPEAVPDEVFAAIAAAIGTINTNLSEIKPVAKQSVVPIDMGGMGATNAPGGRRNLGFGATQLYTGNLAVGSTITVATLAQYNCFVVVTQGAYITCFRIGSALRGTGFSPEELFDAARFVAFQLDISTTTSLKLSYCKYTDITSSPVGRTDTTVTAIYGVF